MQWLCASLAVQAINPQGGYIVGVSNPAETVVGILALIDEVRTKVTGTKLAAFPWRPASPEAAEELADLATEALTHCDDVTEAMIVVTVAATLVASSQKAVDPRH
jgi:hypothetical protein